MRLLWAGPEPKRLDTLLSALFGAVVEYFCYYLGRWTVIALTLGTVRPIQTVRSERWLSALGVIELLVLLIGGFVLWLYHG
jgi:hypothetical protein